MDNGHLLWSVEVDQITVPGTNGGSYAVLLDILIQTQVSTKICEYVLCMYLNPNITTHTHNINNACVSPGLILLNMVYSIHSGKRTDSHYIPMTDLCRIFALNFVWKRFGAINWRHNLSIENIPIYLRLLSI